MMLLTKQMQKEILELLCHLISKIELHRRDLTTNFILEMDWVNALSDLVVEEETKEIKIILIARHFKFLIDKKQIYNETTVEKIKRVCAIYGITNVAEFARKNYSNLYNDVEEVIKQKRVSSNEEYENTYRVMPRPENAKSGPQNGSYNVLIGQPNVSKHSTYGEPSCIEMTPSKASSYEFKPSFGKTDASENEAVSEKKPTD